MNVVDGVLICECGLPMRARTVREEFNYTGKGADDPSEMTTLVGFSSPPGHRHDDNCTTRIYSCENQHGLKISIRQRCPVCDWVGKEICGCHDGKKVDEWPK